MWKRSFTPETPLREPSSTDGARVAVVAGGAGAIGGAIVRALQASGRLPRLRRGRRGDRAGAIVFRTFQGLSQPAVQRRAAPRSRESPFWRSRGGSVVDWTGGSLTGN